MSPEEQAPDDEEVSILLDVRDRSEKAEADFQEGVERLLSGLSLPLTDSLGVPPEEVPRRSQPILEELVLLRLAREAALSSAEKAMTDFIVRFPEEEREEVRARLAVMGMLFD